MTAATDVASEPGGALESDATAAAEAAARSAGVQVRQLGELAELRAVESLIDSIWRPAGQNSPVTGELLRALVKAGSYVGGAFDDGELVGACVGFFSPPRDETLHSHIAGVAARLRGRSVGFALKAHQRAWALERGVRDVEWTFDPLVRRNAYFNIGKLAAEAAEYLPNFYGHVADGINGADDTDRLLVTWPLRSAAVAAACARRPDADAAAGRDPATVALAASAGGRPAAGSLDGSRLLVAVPHDVEALRVTDPGSASAWRSAVRDVLGGLLAEGARVTGFDQAGWYVVDRHG